jgi:receptor protein-tyrosine kinase
VREVIRSLLERVDYVIVDTAPLLAVADGAEVAALADGCLLVARHGVTTDGEVRRASATLERVDAKLLGVVLNRVPNRRGGEYAYTYYRSDGPPSAHAKDTGRRFGRRRGRPAPSMPGEGNDPYAPDETDPDGLRPEWVRERSGGHL